MIPSVTKLIHLDYDGKTARLSLQPLPDANPKPSIRRRTSKGDVTLSRVVTGINPRLQSTDLTSTQLIEMDPELDLNRAGHVVQPEIFSTTYFESDVEDPVPVSDFNFIDVIVDPSGQEKERRPHLTRQSNLNDLMPVKIGKRLSLATAFTSYIFKLTYQIVHEDGLTMDFLFNIASELHTNQKVAVVGTGSKGNQPLVIRDKGSPYRGFLYGEIDTTSDERRYKLLLLLSDQELRRPSVD